jgi:LacI family transcriptional regulator
MPEKHYKVAVFVETSRAYGRALCEGIADFAQANGHWIFEGGGESWEEGLREIAGRADGVIARIPNAKMARALARLRIPVVDLYRWRDYPSISSVDADHEAIGRLAAAWFIERRFKKFAFCGYTGAPFSDARGGAFKATLEAGGHTCDFYKEAAFSSDFLGKMILQAESYGDPPDRDRMAAWLESLERPTAIFCCHDIRAYQVVALCKEVGLAVPRDVAVMGVDNDRILCGFSDPMLSSVDPDAQRIGWTGAQRLFDLMSGKSKGVGHALVSPKRVVERASTETDPVEPQWLSEALRFIRKEIPGGVNAAEVIRHVGLSHTQVERAFVKALGNTVHQEISRLRMREACRLLTETAHPVATVGKLAGFTSPQYFSRLFSGQFGVTPGAYRSRPPARGFSD